MRESLFRGKRKDNGEWVEGFYLFHGSEVYILAPEQLAKGLDVGGWLNGCQAFEVDPETVGRYTGLKDENGQRIFEGDVVEQNWYDYMEPADDSFGVVMFCEYDCSFSVMNAEDHSIKPLGSCTAFHWEAKVIGNIHDAEYRSDTQQEATKQ